MKLISVEKNKMIGGPGKEQLETIYACNMLFNIFLIY